MLQRNPNDSHASVLPPHTSTEKRAQNTGARSELSSNQWWPEPPNIDYRRSNTNTGGRRGRGEGMLLTRGTARPAQTHTPVRSQCTGAAAAAPQVSASPPPRAPAHELLAPRTVVAAPATRTICGAKTATVDAIAQSPRYSGRRCGRRCPGTAITTPVLPQLLSSPAGCCHDR
jgi:hypothetical protein